MGKARFTSKDNGFRRFIAMGKKLAGKPHVKVGFLEATNARSVVVKKGRTVKGVVKSRGGAVGTAHDLTNAELAIILHFGTRGSTARGRIPPRPFMRVTMQRERNGWKRLLMRIGRDFLRGKASLAEGLAALGARAVADVKRTMRDGLVPDAPSTVEEKGRDDPLIDTRKLLESVTSEVMP